MGATIEQVRDRAVVMVAGVRSRNRRPGVALTFDDGPHLGSTDLVLDLLHEMNVRATFFCVGKNAAENPDLVRRMRLEGHAVGSHSLNHLSPAQMSNAVMEREYAEGHWMVQAASGASSSLFRPPEGIIRTRQAPIIRRLKLQPWLWSVDPKDWRIGATSDSVLAAAAVADDGDVILLHDWVEAPPGVASEDRSATIDALPRIIESIRQRDRALVTLHE